MACEHYERTHSRLKKNHRSEALILKALANRFGELTVNRIGQPEIAQLRDDLLLKGRSGTTVAHYLNAVSKVYQMLKAECVNGERACEKRETCMHKKITLEGSPRKRP
jgi:hypothetical protein